MLIALALALSTSAQAQQVEPTVGLSAGPWFHSAVDDEGVSLVAVPRLGARFGDSFALELDLAVGLGTTTDGRAPYATFLPSLTAVISLWPELPVQPLVELGGGAVRSSVDGRDPVNLTYFSPGLGALIPVTDRLDLRADLRPQVRVGNAPLTDDLGWWDVEALVGFQVRLGGDSAPTPPLDSDEDGIVDRKDACIEAPEDADGIQDDDGCPEEDADGDGVVDVDDACPLDPADTDDGCPVSDRDGDGLADARDRCPDVAGTVMGCPDGDGDAIADAGDACPDEAAPGTVDGCPAKARVTGDRIEIDGTVLFSSGGSTIQAESFELLQEVAGVLQAYPQITAVEVAGHTDASGPEAGNLKLSQARAEAVRSYLIEQGGIDGSRLTAKGYGETKPIASNETPEGKAKNRRVAFDIKGMEQAE